MNGTGPTFMISSSFAMISSSVSSKVSESKVSKKKALARVGAEICQVNTPCLLFFNRVYSFTTAEVDKFLSTP